MLTINDINLYIKNAENLLGSTLEKHDHLMIIYTLNEWQLPMINWKHTIYWNQIINYLVQAVMTGDENEWDFICNIVNNNMM